jgi:phosphoglycolate phosphatase-like HAD superfamily hydrolase
LHLTRRVTIEAILLDIDGTLIDSNDRHTDCWVEAFAHFGKQIEWKSIRGQIGKGGDLLVPDSLNAREMRTFGEALKQYRGELWSRNTCATCSRFRAPSTPCARCTSAASSSRSHRLRIRRGRVLCRASRRRRSPRGNDVEEDATFSKPSPEIFQAALERVKSDPARTLAVGDTPYDILAAHRTPVPIAAVLCGGFPRESLAKAEFLFDDVPAMVKELDRIDDEFRD